MQCLRNQECRVATFVLPVNFHHSMQKNTAGIGFADSISDHLPGILPNLFYKKFHY